jgi:uroporphyrinogen-III synthase
MTLVLAGFTVAVTADRRRDELAGLLERQGARVVLAPALRIVPLADDTRLRVATRELLERPPDVVVANTAIGMRGWLEAAEGWGLGESLRARLAEAYLVARGPKARDALHAAGLTEAWSPESESIGEVLDHLDHLVRELNVDRDQDRRAAEVATGAEPATRARHAAPAAPAQKTARPTVRSRRPRATVGRRSTTPLAGWRVAVQLHGEPQEEFCGALVAAGAEVVEVPVYRWVAPLDPTPLQRLVDLITNRMVDAVTFTSAPAVNSLLRAAGPDTDAVIASLSGEVLAGCVGPLTAAPLVRLGVPVLAPPVARLGALARALVDELPRRTRTLRVADAELVLRGHAAVVDGVLKPLPPAQMAILRALAVSPGRVLPRSELLEALPRGADEHAVEMAVARLRAALGASSFIQTVVKRGYRLRVD